MKILNREQIKGKHGRRVATVHLPELDGHMKMRSPSAAAALEYNRLIKRKEAGDDVEKDLAVSIITSTCVDEEGKPMFTKETALEFLDTVSVETMTIVLGEAAKLSNPEASNAGNSQASQSSSSPTDSPSP